VPGLDTLRQLISRHARNSHGPTAIDGLTISATDAPTSPRAGVAEPCLGLVVQGRKRTVSGDRVFDYAAGEFLIAQLALPVTGQVTQASAECPFLGIGVLIEPAEIAAMLLEAAVTPGGTPARAPGIAVASAGEPLLDALAHLAGLLDTPQDVPVLAPLYRREVFWRLRRTRHHGSRARGAVGTHVNQGILISTRATGPQALRMSEELEDSRQYQATT
jgi:hypothetical protein